MKTTKTTLRVQTPTSSATPARVQVNGNRKRKPGRHDSAEPDSPIHHATLVEAKVDVGWGNALFIRGQGAGLSWDKGAPLACLDNSTWAWLSNGVTDKVTFKLLLNDEAWSEGGDYMVEPGRRIEIQPQFPCVVH